MSLTKQEKITKLLDALKATKLDASVMGRTLGAPVTYVTPQLMLASSQKLLGVASRKVEEDDRDHMFFSRVLGPEDFVKEHIEHDAGKLQLKAKMKLRQKRNLSWLHAGFFTPQVRSVFVGNTLAQNIEGVNPMEQYALAHKVTKMGEGGIGCHSEDTEVFTSEGWKLWPAVTETDRLAVCLDGKLNFKKPNKLFSGQYTGDMIEIDGLYVNGLITPNHRVFASNPRYNRHTKTRSYSPFSFRTAEEAFASRWKYPLSFNAYTGGRTPETFALPPAPFNKSNKATQEQRTLLFDPVLFASLVGCYLADGSFTFSERRKEYRVEIGKSIAANPDEVAYIADLLTSLDIKHRYEQGRRFIITGKNFAYYFKQFGKSKDKFIPTWIMQGSLEIRTACFSSLTRMDCSGRLACGGSRYESASRQLRDQAAFLALTLGYHVNYTDSRYFKAKINARKDVNLCEANYKQVPYTGMVYCASVPGELLLTRRKGKCFWSGNSTTAIPDSSRQVSESQFGLIDPLQTVEATTIGVVNFFVNNLRKGNDGKVYRQVIDNETGKPVWIDHQTFLSTTVEVPEH